LFLSSLLENDSTATQASVHLRLAKFAVSRSSLIYASRGMLRASVDIQFSAIEYRLRKNEFNIYNDDDDDEHDL